MTLQDQMLSLRKLVLQKGLPDESFEGKIIGDTSLIKCSLRGIVWKLLLGALHVDAMHYISLVQVSRNNVLFNAILIEFRVRRVLALLIRR